MSFEMAMRIADTQSCEKRALGEHMPIEKVKAFAGIAGGGPADMMMER